MCANYAEAIVTVQQLGTHACGFNGFKTQKDVRFVARHKDQLELLYGKHAYEIEFNPPPPADNITSRKRSHELEADESGNRRKMLKLANFSDGESMDNGEEVEEKLSTNGAHQETLGAGPSGSSEGSSGESSSLAKWESFDGGKLMVYTASSVQNRSKVILILVVQA